MGRVIFNCTNTLHQEVRESSVSVHVIVDTQWLLITVRPWLLLVHLLMLHVVSATMGNKYHSFVDVSAAWTHQYEAMSDDICRSFCILVYTRHRSQKNKIITFVVYKGVRNTHCIWFLFKDGLAVLQAMVLVEQYTYLLVSGPVSGYVSIHIFSRETTFRILRFSQLPFCCYCDVLLTAIFWICMKTPTSNILV